MDWRLPSTRTRTLPSLGSSRSRRARAAGLALDVVAIADALYAALDEDLGGALRSRRVISLTGVLAAVPVGTGREGRNGRGDWI